MLPWRRARPVVWCLILLGVPALLAAACRAADSDATAADAGAGAGPVDPDALFIGTWRLARTDRYDQRGEPLSHLMHPTVGLAEVLGYLMYDGERVGMVVQRENAEPEPEAPGASEAALAGLARYTAYFGRYAIDEPDGYVTHGIAGSLDPGLTGSEMLLGYELAEDRLVLMPPLQCPDSFVTDRGCGYGTTGIQLRNIWERVDPAPEAGPKTRALLGFWELDRIVRRTADGADAPTEQYAAGTLIYMPSGRMAVHLMRADRRPYAGSGPTPSEADAALRSYVSYFGPFQVLPDEDVVVHHRTGHLDPRAVGSEARRVFTLREGQLLLEPPAATVDGETVRTTVVWNRLGSL